MAKVKFFELNIIEKHNQELKKGIWIYFILLIIEGALRKWVIPSLATPLLLIRDPLAIWMIYKAFKIKEFNTSKFVICTLIISLISFFITFYVGHGNLSVALFGLRITLIQFPVIFIIGNSFSKKDVILLGITGLWVNILMTVLVVIQFFSPQTAWINKGIGDQESSGFSGAMDFARVPGTFSFTNGLSIFYAFVAPFVFYFLSQLKEIKSHKILLICSTICLLAAIPFSLSRSVLVSVITTFIFLIISISNNPKSIWRTILLTLNLILLIYLISLTHLVDPAIAAFTDRISTANENEGGTETIFIKRLLGSMLNPLTNNNVPYWGYGLGMGTNAGSKLLTGSTSFLISEGEWGRIIGEMGMILGLLLISIRFYLFLKLLKESWVAAKKGNILPWLIFSSVGLLILNGQWGQPTSQGFSVLGAGLIIASLKE